MFKKFFIASMMLVICFAVSAQNAANSTTQNAVYIGKKCPTCPTEAQINSTKPVSVQSVDNGHSTFYGGDFVFDFDRNNKTVQITESNITRENSVGYVKSPTDYTKRPLEARFELANGHGYITVFMWTETVVSFVYYHPQFKDLSGQIETIYGKLP